MITAQLLSQLRRIGLLQLILLCCSLYGAPALAQSVRQDSPIQSCLVTKDAEKLPLHSCRQSLPAQQAQSLSQEWASDDREVLPMRWDRYRLSVEKGQEAKTLERVLALGVPSTMGLVVLQEHARQRQLLTRLKPFAVFTDRPVLAPRVQLNLSLAPGEHDLYLGYRIYAGGAIEPELQMLQLNEWYNTSHNLLVGLMIGVTLTLCAGILIYRIVGGRLAFVAYIALVLSEIGVLLQIEGYGFAYVWPNSPSLNRMLTPLFASLVIATHALFAMGFLKLRERFNKLWWAHVLCVLLCGMHIVILLAMQLALDISRSMAMVTVFYAALALIAALSALRQRLPGAPLYALGAASLGIFGFVLFPLGILGMNPFPAISFFLYPKIGVLLETSFFSLALVSQAMQFRSEQADQRMRRLAETEELLQAEAARRQALELAQQQSLQLASASHDIAQPLASLRFAVTALKQKEGSGMIAEHLDHTLEYAQSLLKDVILRSREQLSDELGSDDRIHLGQLMSQVASSQAPAAKAKGLKIKAMPCGVQIQGSQVLLSRILNNLVSNAIRYTTSGRVTIGARYRAGGVELQVLDTGPGLLPTQVKRLMQAFEQGESSQQGYGLGLFIVKSLCEQSGYHFSVQSTLGRGSCFSVLIQAK